MKFCFFGWNFPIWIGKALEKEGHYVLFNQFSPDVDVVVTQGLKYIYGAYRNIKSIKKNKIKLINFFHDVPPWRVQYNYDENSLKNYVRMLLYDYLNRKQFLYDKVKNLHPSIENGKFKNLILDYIHRLFDTRLTNRFTYLIIYKKFMKKADLNLSISKYAQVLAKKILSLDTELCYLCVNSDLLLSIPKFPIKYDAINISRIAKNKRQELFVEAAINCGLNIAVFGAYEDRSIKLNCPHYFIPDHRTVLEELSKARFYVDPSTHEGFGMTPVEAAYLDKIT
ncbi:MAG: hypothetical protein ACFFBP_03945, partial [Promethearchaeota archaeon]